MADRNVIFTKHFIEKAILKGVFDECGFENGKKITEIALKGLGVRIPDKGVNEFKCIFELMNKKLVTVPFVYENDNIIAKTIFPIQEPDRDEYEKAMKFKIKKTIINREKHAAKNE
jgi:hypothetical protein